MVRRHPSSLSSVLIFRLHSFHSNAVESGDVISDKLLGALCGNVLFLSNSLVNTKLSQLAEKTGRRYDNPVSQTGIFFSPPLNISKR